MTTNSLSFITLWTYNFHMEKKDYTVTPLEVTPKTSEEMLTRAFDDDILSRMERVIETEGPVRESLLFKRVLNSYDLFKNGSRLNGLLVSLTESLNAPVTTDRDGEKVYHTGKNEDYFRPTPLSEDRYSYQIPHAEAAACILYILENGNKNSYRKNELYRLFIAEMGYLKSGDQIRTLFDGALNDPRIRISGNGRIMK